MQQLVAAAFEAFLARQNVDGDQDSDNEMQHLGHKTFQEGVHPRQNSFGNVVDLIDDIHQLFFGLRKIQKGNIGAGNEFHADLVKIRQLCGKILETFADSRDNQKDKAGKQDQKYDVRENDPEHFGDLSFVFSAAFFKKAVEHVVKTPFERGEKVGDGNAVQNRLQHRQDLDEKRPDTLAVQDCRQEADQCCSCQKNINGDCCIFSVPVDAHKLPSFLFLLYCLFFGQITVTRTTLSIPQSAL